MKISPNICPSCGIYKKYFVRDICRECNEAIKKGRPSYDQLKNKRNFIRDGKGILTGAKGDEWEVTLEEFELVKDMLWKNDGHGNATHGTNPGSIALSIFLGHDPFAKRRGKIIVNKVTNINPYKEGMIIYKATSPSGKIYIGKTTTSLKERTRGHKNSLQAKKRTKFINAMLKYGFENFKWEVIATTNNYHELNKLEYELIIQYNTISSGYNTQIGGMYGNFGLSPTKVVIEKISKTLTGKPSANKGIKKPEGSYLRVLEGRGIGWLAVYDLSGSFVAVFRRAQEAADFAGCTISGVEYVLSGGVKQCKGYIFRRFKLDEIPDKIEIPKDYFMKSNQFYFEGYKNGKSLGTWNDQRICATELSINYKSINAILKGYYKTIHGYSFKKIAV